MFRGRPLHWLFLLASIAIDLAMYFGGKGLIFEGLIVGQVAALGIWAALGQAYRLTRGSLLVVGIAILALLPGYRSLYTYPRNLTFMGAYALAVVITSLLVAWLRKRVRVRFAGEAEQSPLKVPLIEFFGWTIIVAVASFGARHMDLDALHRVTQQLPVYLLTYAIVPLALILFDSRFRPLHLAKALLFLCGVYWIGAYFLGRGPWYSLKMTTVAAYLTAWMLVRSIEYDQIKTVTEESEQQEDESVKLFEPEQ